MENKWLGCNTAEKDLGVIPTQQQNRSGQCNTVGGKKNQNN